MTRNDGGPAFPSVLYSHERAENWSTDGMSLRDWFAGQALPFCATQFQAHLGGDRIAATVQLSYRIADFMLAERQKP